ncbi:MAG: DUF2279 domain-containing protein [candidate division KSB1 bacterium]|nr:DUF2279 domain-containing protein [candidate division KSB1 bacterium]MDZ7303166.1 DUF2279 domain-containing protein [candidate division KSB1 bacterium]MDZ7310145.1 DUF2279 domain-containing protein [candidate division KSB1 bacterium]
MRRRRRAHRGVISAKAQKRNHHVACGALAPSGLRQPRPGSLKSKNFVWIKSEGILAVAGFFLLLGAAPLNRHDQKLPQAKSTSLAIPHHQQNGISLNHIPPLRGQEFASGRPTSLQDQIEHLENSHASTPEQFAGLELNSLLSIPPELRANPRLSQHLPVMMSPMYSSPSRKIGLRWERLALIEAGSLGLAVFGFQKFDQYFGGPNRSFRIRNDWTKDHTLHFDELLHFQGSYRITQGLIGLYRWSGLSPTWSECLGAGTAASLMTLLEYNDGRRPKAKQGASYSDFMANLLGVGFALAKLHVNALQDFDLRLNYTSFGDIFQKRTLLKYDRMTSWLTYDMERRWHIPLNVGVGYGVRNAHKPNVRSEVYLGLGFTPVDILERYYPAAAKPLAWLGIYHIGWQVQIK